MRYLWSAPLGLRAVLFLLIPWWRGTWAPYWPRRARWHNGCLHVIAGRLIPDGLGDDFRTGAQTHWFVIWFTDEIQWERAQLIAHEERHVWQEGRWGPLYCLIYAGHFLVNLVRYRDTLRAYEAIVFERDARRHAGQRV